MLGPTYKWLGSKAFGIYILERCCRVPRIVHGGDLSVICARQVVVVLPTNRKDKYDSIKKYLCVDCPTPSQCVVSRTLSRPRALMTVATKIVLQMACKMGGELWSVEIPVRHMHRVMWNKAWFLAK